MYKKPGAWLVAEPPLRAFTLDGYMPISSNKLDSLFVWANYVLCRYIFYSNE